jgi:hypothetical protein
VGAVTGTIALSTIALPLERGTAALLCIFLSPPRHIDGSQWCDLRKERIAMAFVGLLTESSD